MHKQCLAHKEKLQAVKGLATACAFDAFNVVQDYNIAIDMLIKELESIRDRTQKYSREYSQK